MKNSQSQGRSQLAFLIAVIGYWAVMVGQAFLTWQASGIVNVAAVCLIFTVVLVAGFNFGGIRLTKFKYTPISALLSTVAGLALAAFAYLTTFSGLERYIRYYPTFPLEKLDTGLGYHSDTAFHSTLMQSIRNFGYPSTGQFGHPVTFYYPMSHYVDALFVSVSGLDIWDSAGLLFHLKRMALVLAIGYCVWKLTQGRSGLVKVVSFLALLPILASNWRAVGSEGMWVASILILFTAPKLIEITKKASFEWRDVAFIAPILLVLDLSKLSSAAMLAVILAIQLLPKAWKTKQYWVLFVAFGAFSMLDSYLFLTSNSMRPVAGNPLVHAVKLLTFRTYELSTPTLKFLYVLIAVFAVVAILLKKFQATWNLVTVAAGTAALGVLATSFYDNNLNYFTFGFEFPLIIWATSWLFEFFDNAPIVDLKRVFKIAVAIVLVGVSFAAPRNYMSLLRLTPGGIVSVIGKANNAIYAEHSQATGRRTTLLSLIQHPVQPTLGIENGQYREFRDALHTFLSSHKLSANQVSLYVPKSVWEAQVKVAPENSWSVGLMLYAVTGVPEVYGSPHNDTGYGYKNYQPNQFWSELTDSQLTPLCGNYGVIVRVVDFANPTFSVVCP